MDRQLASTSVLRDVVSNMDRCTNTAARVQDHQPIQTGNLASAKPGVEAQQDHRVVPQSVPRSLCA
jgi:hypothetical protein